MPQSTSTFSRPALALALVALGVSSSCALVGGDPVEGKWKDRAVLRSCGDVTVAQTERLEDLHPPEVACLEGALRSGSGGELVVRYTTVEGDPITEYRRVTPTGSTEVYTDATEDTFGDGKWSYGSCPTPSSALDSAC